MRSEGGACAGPVGGRNGAMPQLQLPIFPAGLTPITNDLAFQKEDGLVVYFSGHLPVFHHDEKDLKSFRMRNARQRVHQSVDRQRDGEAARYRASVRRATGDREAIYEGASARGDGGLLPAAAAARTGGAHRRDTATGASV